MSARAKEYFAVVCFPADYTLLQLGSAYIYAGLKYTLYLVQFTQPTVAIADVRIGTGALVVVVVACETETSRGEGELTEAKKNQGSLDHNYTAE